MKELAEKNRSYRRFYQDKAITREQLIELVSIGHMTPSGANKQPLRYGIVADPKKNEEVFACLRWAGYYTDWDGPQEGERPSAYIILTTDKGTNCSWDEGIAGQTILLAAAEKGMGGCFIGNVDRERLAKVMDLDETMKISLVIALGYPKEKVVIDTVHAGEDIKYYRDEEQVQHVPKLAIDDILLS